MSSFASSHNQKKDNNKFKTKNNQKCQKLNYGSLTTKKLKKKHSSRPVGGTEMESQVERMCGKAAAGRLSEAAADGAGGTTFVCR